MNKLVIIIFALFFFLLFMLSNHVDSSKGIDRRPAEWQKSCWRSRRSIPCSSLNVLKGWDTETGRFTAGGPPDVGDGERQIKAKHFF